MIPHMNETHQYRQYETRRQTYLEAEIAADRPRGNGRAEVFLQIARLELNRGPLDEQLVRASIDLVNARRDCADFALAGLLRLLYKYRTSPLLGPALLAEIESAAKSSWYLIFTRRYFIFYCFSFFALSERKKQKTENRKYHAAAG
jgi:hypothetical protein